jgi:hypothetical protein
MAGAYARWRVGLGGKHCQVCSSEVHHRALLRWMLSGHTHLDAVSRLLQAYHLPTHKMDIGAMQYNRQTNRAETTPTQHACTTTSVVLKFHNPRPRSLPRTVSVTHSISATSLPCPWPPHGKNGIAPAAAPLFTPTSFPPIRHRLAPKSPHSTSAPIKTHHSPRPNAGNDTAPTLRPDTARRHCCGWVGGAVQRHSVRPHPRPVSESRYGSVSAAVFAVH